MTDRIDRTDRKPVRDRYDAVLDFTPLQAMPEAAYVLVKQTFSFESGVCRLTEPVALQHDLRDPNLTPRMPPGSDFWVHKEATDVVVRGAAYAPEGRAVAQMDVSVRIGRAIKRVRVLGKRVVQWRGDGRPAFPGPERFTSMPMTYERAYGGIDPRFELQPPRNPQELLDFDLFDYPGLYPRNLHGTGYLVLPGELRGVELPNLENPDDLLTPERLVVHDPARWYQQPLPWCFDWTNPLMFPRMTYLGLAPRFPPPTNIVLPEVAAGYIDAQSVAPCTPDEALERETPPGFYQDASLGMCFTDLAPGTPIEIQGMHPDRPTVTFDLPEPPELTIQIDGQVMASQSRLTHCVVEPHRNLLMLTYVALVVELPRALIPGVHKRIPFQVRVDGDEAIEYVAPTPVLEQLESGERHV